MVPNWHKPSNDLVVGGKINQFLEFFWLWGYFFKYIYIRLLDILFCEKLRLQPDIFLPKVVAQLILCKKNTTNYHLFGVV
jgi:hypothetical protein